MDNLNQNPSRFFFYFLLKKWYPPIPTTFPFFILFTHCLWLTNIISFQFILSIFLINKYIYVYFLFFYLNKKYFLMWTIFLKSLLNLLQYCFCIMFWFFGHEACGILAPQPGIEPTLPALEVEVLTTGPPGKSLYIFLFFPSYTQSNIW